MPAMLNAIANSPKPASPRKRGKSNVVSSVADQVSGWVLTSDNAPDATPWDDARVDPLEREGGVGGDRSASCSPADGRLAGAFTTSFANRQSRPWTSAKHERARYPPRERSVRRPS